jgi:hypothetical protein
MCVQVEPYSAVCHIIASPVVDVPVTVGATVVPTVFG